MIKFLWCVFNWFIYDWYLLFFSSKLLRVKRSSRHLGISSWWCPWTLFMNISVYLKISFTFFTCIICYNHLLITFLYWFIHVGTVCHTVQLIFLIIVAEIFLWLRLRIIVFLGCCHRYLVMIRLTLLTRRIICNFGDILRGNCARNMFRSVFLFWLVGFVLTAKLTVVLVHDVDESILSGGWIIEDILVLIDKERKLMISLDGH